MSWYEETSKNDNNEENNRKSEPVDGGDGRTVDSQGYINPDDPAHREEKLENVYDRPFEGTVKETIDTPAPAERAEKKEDEPQPEKKEDKSGNSGPEKVPYYEVKVKPKKKGITFGRVIAACLVCSLGLGTGLGAGYGISRSLNRTQGSTYDGVLTTTASAVSSIKSNSAADAISAVYNAVVSITTLTKGTANYGLYSVPYQAQGAGSGVIFSEDDTLVYVATNEHVINGAQNIAIAFDDADETIPATVVGYDETTDLAVLSVEKADLEAQGIKNVTIATFDDSGSVALGEQVVAIGNSLGEGKTTTGGMISATNNAVTVE